uniref:Kazal-like domain-containing protein n=1 Tax=Castor canadensis TaxID=51338 RepID=A0A8C0XF69_CASCN
MKVTTVPMLLTLALCLIQDAATEDANQGTCSEFQAFIRNGKLFCPQDKLFKSPDGMTFINKCVTCKAILEKEAKFQKKNLPRATRATAPAKLNCDELKKGEKDGELICTGDVAAVCGTDGKTYRSRCELCAENVKTGSHVDIKSEGECEKSSPEEDICSAFRPFVKDGRLGCTRENDPVLGPDGRTHGNKCAMCAELFLKEAEENAKREGGNRIQRDTENELCKEFESQVRSGRLFCTRESDPVRGPDGRMHGNKCALCAEIFMRRFSEEKNKADQNLRKAEEKIKAKREVEKLCSEYQDRAKNGILFCTRENDPVRGPDGKMHGNMCSMCQAFFRAEAEERKKAKSQARNKRGSEKTPSYAKLCSGYRNSRKNGQLLCTRENDPIQGPDGKMHGNTCSMCEAFFKQEDKARAKAKREAAKESCTEFRDQSRDGMLICTRENDPVLGPDGKMHANKCAMCASVELCREYRQHVRNGRLSCTRENDPIEGLDGKIHGNTCSMCEAFFLQEAKEKEAESRAKAKREAEKDTCSEFRSLLQNGNLYCTRENDPVRGPDGKTHGNKCAMCKAVFQREDEERKRKEEENQRNAVGHRPNGGGGKTEDPCAEFREIMKNGKLSCTRESDPVRGADGKSYNNKCAMCKELLQREIEEKENNSGLRSNGTGPRKDVCDQFRSQMKNGQLICTRESDPVRGPDGKTHGNKCSMCKEKLEREAAEKKKKEEEGKRNREGKGNDKEDQCHEFRSKQKDGKLICTRENDPVRGPYGKMHLNKCAMCQSIFEREASERKKNDEEKSSSKPSNDAKDQCKEVPNEAEDAKFRQSGSSLASIQKCSDECGDFRKYIRNDELRCTRENDPVRGADGKLYKNECYKCRAVFQKEALERAKLREKPSHIRAAEEIVSPDSPNSSLDSEICKQYRILPRMGYICSKNFEPVCGDDGQTYRNPCMLCHENLMRQTNIHIRHKGSCEENSTPETVPAGLLASDKTQG